MPTRRRSSTTGPTRRRTSSFRRRSSLKKPTTGSRTLSSPSSNESGRRSGRLHGEELDLEDERGAGRDDAAGAALAVAQVRGNDQLALAAHLHGAHAFVPALDHSPLADREHERLAAIHRAIELLAALDYACVVH